jgi:hypothetical protein
MTYRYMAEEIGMLNAEIARLRAENDQLLLALAALTDLTIVAKHSDAARPVSLTVWGLA